MRGVEGRSPVASQEARAQRPLEPQGPSLFEGEGFAGRQKLLRLMGPGGDVEEFVRVATEMRR